MNRVDSFQKERDPEFIPRYLVGDKWTLEKPELLVTGEWIELGRKLRSASDEEIFSFIGSVETHLEGKLNDETLSDTDYREYVRSYAQTALNAARAALRRRNLGQLD